MPRTSEPSATIPFGQEFTPPTLGKTVGEDRVLGWLLETAKASESKASLAREIEDQCLAHVPRPKDRRDMASHVVTALRSYRLISTPDADPVLLTEAGEAILTAEGASRDRLFARHILLRCAGQRLVDTILTYQIRGERALLEDLARELEGSPTSKNISAMRAWLARADIFPGKRSYEVDPARIEDLLGSRIAEVYHLEGAALELVMAIQQLTLQSGEDFVRASQAASLAEDRQPGIRIPRKALGQFVKGLEERGLLEIEKHRGAGGTGWAVRLVGAARDLSSEELGDFIAQSDFRFGLHNLLPLQETLRRLATGHAERLGYYGEMLAAHLCIALGLERLRWRQRAPAAEIDLSAEKVTAFAYQRWHIQVKNTQGKLDIDRVDRELGAAAGLGITHLLFVVPRSSLTGPAKEQLLVKSRLTPVHAYALTRNELAGFEMGKILKSLRSQTLLVAHAKRSEARRRGLGGEA